MEYTWKELAPKARQAIVKASLGDILAKLTAEAKTSDIMAQVVTDLLGRGYFPELSAGQVHNQVSREVLRAAEAFPAQAHHDGEEFTTPFGSKARRWRWTPSEKSADDLWVSEASEPQRFVPWYLRAEVVAARSEKGEDGQLTMRGQYLNDAIELFEKGLME